MDSLSTGSAGEKLLVYGTGLSYAALLLLGGFAAGTVAQQIRQHVIAALHEAENRVKIAQLAARSRRRPIYSAGAAAQSATECYRL